MHGGASCLEKRQCTVQFTIFADGETRVKPLVLFRGKGKRNTLVKLADDDEVCTDEGHLLMTIVKITHTLIVMIFSLGS